MIGEGLFGNGSNNPFGADGGIRYSQAGRPATGPLVGPGGSNITPGANLGGRTGFQDAYDLFSGLDAPAREAMQKRLDDLQYGTLPGQNAQYDELMSLMRQSAGLDGAKIGNALAGNNIDRAAAERQIGVIDQLLGLSKGDFERQAGFLEQMLGLAEGDLKRGLGYVDQQEGFANRQKGLSYDAAGLARDSRNRSTTSSATASGAISSAGFAATMSDIARQYGLDISGANLTSDATLAGLANRRGDLQAGFEKDKAGNAKAVGDNYSSWQRTQIQSGEDQNKLRDRLATLDNAAAGLGIQRSELELGLRKGLVQLGIQRDSDTNRTLDQILDGIMTGSSREMQVYKDALAAAGMFGK